MYVVIETGGKQYRAAPGEFVNVEKLPVEVGEQLTLDRVLLVADGAEVRLGQPTVTGVTVLATVVAQRKARKVTSYHYQAKKRVRNIRGHRQWYTRLRIEKIQA